MTDAPDDAPPARRQSPKVRVLRANLGPLLVTVVVMGVAMLIANQLHLGAAALLAGFTAIFFAVGVGGGALRADLRKVAWYGPLTAVSASVPRLVADYNHGLALGLVCVIIFIAGVLPALGSNYAASGLALGIATLLGFALQTPTGSAAATIGAGFVGVAVVVVLRILLTMRDPSRVTRDLVAATFSETNPGFGRAYAMWLRDRPVRWLGECLHASVGYRTIEATLAPEEAEAADDCADIVAANIVAANITPRRFASGVDRPEPPADATSAYLHALRILDRADSAARARPTTVAPGASVTPRAVPAASLRSVLTWRSEILRHAIRATLGVLLTFLVAWATVGTDDPLVVSMAIASFAVLQTGWTQSLLKAKQRILGVGVGAAVMALLLWAVPTQWLLPCALLAAASGVWFIVSNQVLSIGSFVVTSVGMNTATRSLDPVSTLIEYVILLFTAVGIGLLLGFVAIPHVRADPVGRRVQRARQAVIDLLRPTDTSIHIAMHREYQHIPRAVARALGRVFTEAGNLRSPLNAADERAGTDPDDCQRLATQLETRTMMAILEVREHRLRQDVIDQAAEALANPAAVDSSAPPSDEAPNFVRLARWIGENSERLLTTTPLPRQA